MFVGQTQEPAPYSRTVRIGMIMVMAQDEEEEDIMMESNGEGDNGQYEYTEYMHADNDDDDGPPEYTTADEGYEGGEGEYDTPQGRPTIHGTETRNAGSLVEWGSNGDTEDHMEISSPAGQLVLREPDFGERANTVTPNFS